MRRKTIFLKMVIGALLLSILSGCGKKAGVDYIQENDSRQDAVSASDLHLNYSVSNGHTTVNVDADVNTSLSTQSAPVATAVRCDYTNEDITRIAAAIFDEGSYKLFLPYSHQSKEDITAACDAFAETFATYADKSEIPYIICWRNAPMHKVRKPAVSLILSRQMERFNTIRPSRNFATTVISVAR